MICSNSFINRIKIRYCGNYGYLRLVKYQFSKYARIKYQQYPVQDYQIGARLDRYLKKYPLGGWPSIQMLIRNKDIIIQTKDGQKVRQNSYIMKQGDFLLINQNLKHLLKHQQDGQSQDTNPHHQIDFQKAKAVLDSMTIFDNENITVFNKKSGYTVQGGNDFQKNLFSLMKARYKKQYVHIVHRLDKPTSGVLFFAKNLKTASLLQSAMEERLGIEKIYLAYTTGAQIHKKQGYLRSNIEWSSKSVARVCGQGQQGSKDSITYYKVLRQSPLQNNEQNSMFLNLLGLKILTGRKHQIRCHVSHFLDNRIVNDTKYKGQKHPKLKQEEEIMLHASRIVIDSSQIINRVFNFRNNSRVKNQNGQIKIQQEKLIIEANVPQFWDNVIKFDDNTDTMTFNQRERQFKKNLKKQTKVIKIQ